MACSDLYTVKYTVMYTVRTVHGDFGRYFTKFYEALRMEKDGKNKKNQPIFNVLALNIGWFGGVREI